MRSASAGLWIIPNSQGAGQALIRLIVVPLIPSDQAACVTNLRCEAAHIFLVLMAVFADNAATPLC